MGSAATAAVRPESIRVCERETPGMNNIAGTVEIGLFIGEAVDYHVVVGDELVRVKGDPHSRFRRRDPVFLEISPSDCVLIPPDRAVGATPAPVGSPVEPELERA